MCLSQQLENGCGPPRFICSGARNRGDWDPGHRYCLRPAAGGIHIIHIFTSIHIHISHSWIFLLISQTGEQDEVAEALYV